MIVGARFPIGDTGATGLLKSLIDARQINIIQLNGFILRHAQGTWGDVSEEQVAANEHAVVNGGEIRSRYVVSADGDALSIVTTADRSQTILSLERATPGS